MTVKLLTEHHLEFLSLKGSAKAFLSLHLSKYHIVDIHMSWPKCPLRVLYMGSQLSNISSGGIRLCACDVT